MGQNFACTSGYLDPRIVSFVESRIRSSKILVVSKSSCTACTQAKQLLRVVASRTGVNASVFEVDKYAMQCTKGIMNYISAQTGINTVPQIYINGRFVGGNVAVQRLHREGRLLPLILQPMQAPPSINSADHVYRSGLLPSTSAPSLRVSAFQTDFLPFPTFEKLMPVTINNPMINDEMKSNDFSYHELQIGASGRSRSRSTLPSVERWSSPSSFIENKRGVPQGRRTTMPSLSSQSLSSSFIESKLYLPQRRWSSISSSPSVNSNVKSYNGSQSSLLSSDIDILNQPARLRSTPSYDSSRSWHKAKSNSVEYLRDEKILSKSAVPAVSNQKSWVRSSIRPSLQEFLTIENEWLPNSRKQLPATPIAKRAREAITVYEPINTVTSNWLHIFPEVI